MSSRNLITIVIVIATLALGLGYVLGASRTARAPVTEPDDAATAPPTVAFVGEQEQTQPRAHISRETLEKMYYGVSYEDAEELFGAPSDEYDTEYNPGVEGYTSPFVIHWNVWRNEDGSKTRLGFINNKMDRKQYIAADGTNLLPEPPHTDEENYGRHMGIVE